MARVTYGLIYDLRAINETIRYITEKHGFGSVNSRTAVRKQVNQAYTCLLAAVKIVRSLHKPNDSCILNAKTTVVNF